MVRFKQFRIIFVSMNQVLISLGSNEDPESNISLCRCLLSDFFDVVFFSQTSVTVPYGIHYKNNFLNQLAFAHTNRTKEEVELTLKRLEKQMGRLPSDKANGVVKIDIDLIKWNDVVLRKEEWGRDYITLLLPDLMKNITDSAPDRR